MKFNQINLCFLLRISSMLRQKVLYSLCSCSSEGSCAAITASTSQDPLNFNAWEKMHYWKHNSCWNGTIIAELSGNTNLVVVLVMLLLCFRHTTLLIKILKLELLFYFDERMNKRTRLWIEITSQCSGDPIENVLSLFSAAFFSWNIFWLLSELRCSCCFSFNVNPFYSMYILWDKRYVHGVNLNLY